MIIISISSYTVEPVRATTPRKQPPPMSDRLSKSPIFPSQNPIIKPLVNDKLSKAISNTLWPDGLIVFHCFEPLVSDCLGNGMLPVFAVCTTPL